MAFVRVDPDDAGAVAASVEILNAAMAVDDPTSPPIIAEIEAPLLRYGWDLEPDERFLYTPSGETEPVGVLDVALPMRDNRHLLWTQLTVHPDHRRLGHGSVLMAEAIRRAQQAGRTTLWIGTPADDPGARAFAERFGFAYASRDARRRQVLADVDRTQLDRLYDEARVAAAEYELERLTPPVPDEVLAELVEVTAAINDAPMGDLTYEDEVFDLQRLKDFQTARDGIGDRLYRVAARHRASGRVGGHTVVVTHPLRPSFGVQGDTAVSREHRGHRLGLLVKIEMMRWLAEAEPQLEVIETWNNADNYHMINVNEAIGYRLSRVFTMYELTVPTDGTRPQPEPATIGVGVG